jgi:uncharacterized protein (DUF952 family)
VTYILHMTTAAAWEAGKTAGDYRADSLDTQGFIHCSTAEQVARVANKHYTRRADLVLLVIDGDQLHARWLFEPPINPATGQPEPGVDELFPHIYGTINPDAVVDVAVYPPDAQGEFHFPQAVADRWQV